jgi:hypothetical protein
LMMKSGIYFNNSGSRARLLRDAGACSAYP